MEADAFREEKRCDVRWGLYSGGTGTADGRVEELTPQGCILRTCEPIEHQRWVRIALTIGPSLAFTAIGRVIAREDRMENRDHALTLHRHEVEFVIPINPVFVQRIYFSSLILDFESRKATARSSRMRNSRSSRRPSPWA
jgi:hypothetical protein